MKRQTNSLSSYLIKGWNDPISFYLPRSELLEELLIENGPSTGRYEKQTGRFAHLKDSPITSKVVIQGPQSKKKPVTNSSMLSLGQTPKEL